MMKILVVGQTPPPYHGQAIAIQRMLEGCYKNIRLYHVRMAFSKDVDDVGKFSVRKVLHTFKIVYSILYMRVRYNIEVLYYVPAATYTFSVYRDILILLLCRYFFRKTIFHFHSAGLSSVYETLPFVVRGLFRLAYFKPDLGISLSEYNPKDAEYIGSKKIMVIPYGIDDDYAGYIAAADGKHPERVHEEKPAVPVILYLGSVMESKGVFTLLEICSILKKKKLAFKTRIIGKIKDKNFERRIGVYIQANGLTNIVELPGPAYGDEKWCEFAGADIFCFPTYFEHETFGLVVLEAMQFKLPVVAAKWRGVQSIIEDGYSGYLVRPKDPEGFAEKIEQLLRDQTLREQMGARGRMRFLEKYTIDIYHRNLEREFLSIIAN
jgi:glycosyltransferase involved in cell wall biosynthesis